MSLKKFNLQFYLYIFIFNYYMCSEFSLALLLFYLYVILVKLNVS